MLYTIRIHYRTGDSFGSEITHDELPVCWTKLCLAETALETISLHKNACDEIRTSRYQADNQRLILEYSSEYWFVPANNTEYFYSLNVMMDTYELQRIHAFWMGYFETIISAEIIQYETESLIGKSIEF